MFFSKMSKPWLHVSLFSLMVSTAHAQSNPAFLSWGDDDADVQTETAQEIQQENTPAPINTLQDFALQNPNKVIDLAFSSLEKGLYEQATTLFDVLLSTEYADVATYGQALALAQTGQFNTAYTKLSDIIPTHFDPSKVSEQLNILALLQAQQHLVSGEPEKSQSWLRRFIGNTATDEDRAQFSRIYTSLQTSAAPAEAERLRLGLLLPMSGPLKSVGQDIYNAAQMALFEHGMRSLYLYPHDTAGSPEYTQQAAQNAFKDGAQILVGPLLAENTQIAANVARYNKAPVLSFSSLEDMANRNVYLLSYIPNEQAERIAAYAADKGVKTVAALVPNTPYGTLMLEAFERAAEKFGLEFKRSATFESGTTDHSKALDILGQMDLAAKEFSKEKALLNQEYAILGEAMDDVSLTRYNEIQDAKPQPIVDFDALFIPASSTDLPLLASQLAFYDMDSSQITLLGTGQWQNQEIFKNRAEYIRGGFFPGSGSATNIAEFNRKFEQAYGHTPNPLAVLGYDAIKIVAEVYNAEGGVINNFSDALTRREGFSLTSGPIRFTKQGKPERVYNIYRLRSRSAVVEQSAPNVMPPALPEPLNPMQKKTNSVFDLFDGWNF